MFSVLQLIAQAPTPTPSPGASAQSLPGDWGWVLALIAGGALVVLLLLFWFYKKVQDSTFVEKLLGLPTTQWPPRRRSLRRTQAAPLTPKTTPRSRATPGAFRFADEFLARRAEFWLLYAQACV